MSVRGVFIQQNPAQDFMPEVFAFYKESPICKIRWCLSLGLAEPGGERG